MMDVIPNKRMNGFVGNNVDSTPQIFTQLKHESPAIK